MSPQKRARSSSRRRRRGERGSVSIELVVLLPALFAVMFLGMQAALYYHAKTVAIAAAQQGARAAGAEQGRESDGVGAANDFLAEAGGDDVITTDFRRCFGDGDTVHTDFAVRDQTLRFGTTVGQTSFQQRNVKTNHLNGITVSQWFSNNRHELFVRKYGVPER